MANLTLLDIAKLNGNDKIVGLIEENLTAAPEVSVFPVRQIRGLNYYTVKRTGFPDVSFRNANEGVTPSKSSFTKSLVETFILSAAVKVDKAVAAAYEDGAPALEMLEASGVMRQALIEIGSQIWYGTTADAKGFAGIKASITYSTSTGIVLNSGGSDADVQTGVYFVKFGTQDVTLIAGNGTTFDLSEFRDQQLYDSNDAAYAGRVADMTAWLGLQIGNTNCAGRIANVGQDTETGDTLTDSKIAQLLQKFPVGYRPDAIFMNRRSLGQLQRSRTVVINANGNTKGGTSVENIPDIPESAFGIPIYPTDSILNTDAVES